MCRYNLYGFMVFLSWAFFGFSLTTQEEKAQNEKKTIEKEAAPKVEVKTTLQAETSHKSAPILEQKATAVHESKPLPALSHEVEQPGTSINTGQIKPALQQTNKTIQAPVSNTLPSQLPTPPAQAVPSVASVKAVPATVQPMAGKESFESGWKARERFDEEKKHEHLEREWQRNENESSIVQPISTVQIQPVAPVANGLQTPESSSVIKPQAPIIAKINQTQPVAQTPATSQSTPAPLAAPTRAPFKAPVTAPEVEQEEPQGLDTTGPGETQGNWLFKRMWWQRGQTQYEKIKGAVESIMESRMAFFAKRTEWDKTIFDPFYQDSGLARGVLEELIGSLISQLDQERTREGQLDEKERDLLGALESQKELLEQLQKDVQKINDIDNAVDEAISVLIRQINVARNFEKQAWQNFKTIAQELNDKKARELYYGMVTYWQNINDIGQYIQMPFLQHFEKLGVMAKDQTAKVLDALKALKEKGIDFKKQWQQLEENNARQHFAHDHKEDAEQEKREDEASKAPEQGFFASVFNAITDAATASWSYIKSIGQTAWDFTIGRFFAKKVEPIEETAHESAVASHEEISPAVHEKQEHTDDQHDEQMNEPSTEHNG